LDLRGKRIDGYRMLAYKEGARVRRSSAIHMPKQPM